jgi:hypothetical protein
LAGFGEVGCWLFAIGDWLTNGDDTHFSLTSVSGHSRRFRDIGRESAFPPLTDITSKTDHVGKVP